MLTGGVKVGPEQTAREERERAMAVASEAKRRNEEVLADQKRLAQERRTEKQRSDEAAALSRRDQAVLKAYPDVTTQAEFRQAISIQLKQG